MGRLRALIGKGMRFCVTTLVALTFHLVINVGGHELLGIDSNVLYPITLLAISLSTFLLFRFFVYPEAREKNIARQGGGFILATVAFRLTEWGAFAALLNLAHLKYYWCILIVQVTGTVSKFLFFNFFVFGGGAKPHTSDAHG